MNKTMFYENVNFNSRTTPFNSHYNKKSWRVETTELTKYKYILVIFAHAL